MSEFKNMIKITFIDKSNNPDDVGSFFIIVNTLSDLISGYFKTPIKPFTLINDLTFDCPMTLDTYDTIHLCCKGKSWSQISYQFSHELCHLIIGKPIVKNLRWLVESICELSSRFFMLRFAKLWEETGLLGCPNYGDSLVSYVNNLKCEEMDRFSLHDLENDSSYNSMYLKQHEYDRAKNKYVCSCMHPIFDKYPYLWEVIPKIADIPEDLTFVESFNFWISIVDEKFNPALQELKNLFIAPYNSN